MLCLTSHPPHPTLGCCGSPCTWTNLAWPAPAPSHLCLPFVSPAWTALGHTHLDYTWLDLALVCILSSCHQLRLDCPQIQMRGPNSPIITDHHKPGLDRRSCDRSTSLIHPCPALSARPWPCLAGLPSYATLHRPPSKTFIVPLCIMIIWHPVDMFSYLYLSIRCVVHPLMGQ